jgi:glycosyltransferase involved in cell wall biosynthesis
MAGYLQGDDLQRAYRSANLFVFPSWREGFPTVITEAMDAGLPIVTTYIRGAADHLKEGVHACFVPPQNPVALAAAIRRVLAEPELQARMAQANRAKVKEFAPAIIGEQYLGILKQIVDLKQTKTGTQAVQTQRDSKTVLTQWTD